MNRIHRTHTMRLGVALAAIAATIAVAPAVRAEEWTKTYPVSGRPQVRVSTNDGAVRVYTADVKQVELRVEYHGYELNKDLRIDSRQDGDRIALEAKLTNRWCFMCINVKRGLRIEVRMPRSADLNVDTGDGSVETEAIEGKVDIHTGDGHIAVRGAKGDVRLRTGDGHIEAHDLDGNVDAQTGDGHVQMDGRFDVLNIKTGDGSIEAQAATGSKMASSWSIRTGDGSVNLVLPDGFQADMDAQTRDGHITLDFPVTVEGGGFRTSHIHGKLNGGGQPLSVHTGDGSIHLRRA